MTLRILVSPGSGRLRLLPPQRFENGFELVSQGQPVARVEQGFQELVLVSPVDGRVTAVLGLEGEPVVAGQPVMEIEPELAS
jgi:multidrug resistance efflux pump